MQPPFPTLNQPELHPTTSFVGREQDIQEIVQRLQNPVCKVLTLVGPGGVGKTRLALQVVHHLRTHYCDGLYFVALHPLQSIYQIPLAIAQSLQLPIHNKDDLQQQLLQYLQDRCLLLVLDNFEHVMAGISLVTDILNAAPKVKLLITSREALNLHEEWQWVVTGLPYPTDTTTVPSQTYAAMQLFMERVAQVQPNFSPETAYAAIAHICQLVEGNPLAIEMAAHWIKTLTCTEIAETIQQDMDFLTSREHNIPNRHRSMRAVYQYSWDLLPEPEQRVFACLSVFRGGFTRAAAEKIAGATLPILATLVDKSFIRQTSGRYDIHELLRQYGAEQLAIFGIATPVAAAHAAYFADYVAECDAEIKSEHQLAALNKIEADFENIRVAWQYLLDQSAQSVIQKMIDCLFWFAIWRSRIEVILLFDKALATFAPQGDEPPLRVWGQLLMRTDTSQLALIDRALAIAQTYQDDAEIANCLMHRGIYYAQWRQYARAASDLQASLDLYTRLNHPYGMMLLCVHHIYFAMTTGDLEAYHTYLERAKPHVNAIATPTHRTLLLYYIGWEAFMAGRYDEGEHTLNEALSLAQQVGYVRMTTHGLTGFLAFLRGNFDQAWQIATRDLAIATQVRAGNERGFAKIVLAHILCIQGNYSQAHDLAEEAMTLVRPYPMHERFATRVLAMVACGEGNFDQARAMVHQVLGEDMSTANRIWILPVFALLLAHDTHLNKAAEVLGLLFTHPSSITGWLEKWTIFNELRAYLADQLGIETYTAAWQRGASLALPQVVAELLLMTEAQARQPLEESLTDRELEVLNFVACGLSNHAIADALTVTEGTVRTHVYHLCQKLSASNRTHAVARARALHLIQ